MGMYLYVVRYEDDHIRMSDELDNFLFEHCPNYYEADVKCINFEELTKELGLTSKKDLLTCDKVPEDFEKDEFIELAKKLVNDDGLIVFNRLFYGEKKGEAFLFRKKLEKYFPNITPVYPEANVMFVCQK